MSRLRRLKVPRLKKLRVFIPEKHDWALMKLVRYNEKDARDIREVSSRVGLAEKVLVERFLNEMTHVTGNFRELVLSFLLMIETLFGKSEAKRVDGLIKADKRWSQHRS